MIQLCLVQGDAVWCFQSKTRCRIIIYKSCIGQFEALQLLQYSLSFLQFFLSAPMIIAVWVGVWTSTSYECSALKFMEWNTLNSCRWSLWPFDFTRGNNAITGLPTWNRIHAYSLQEVRLIAIHASLVINLWTMWALASSSSANFFCNCIALHSRPVANTLDLWLAPGAFQVAVREIFSLENHLLCFTCPLAASPPGRHLGAGPSLSALGSRNMRGTWQQHLKKVLLRCTPHLCCSLQCSPHITLHTYWCGVRRSNTFFSFWLTCLSFRCANWTLIYWKDAVLFSMSTPNRQFTTLQ